MALTTIEYVYSGQATFPLNFPLGIIDRTHVTVQVNGAVDGSGTPILYTDFTWLSNAEISIEGLATGDTILISRTVPKNELYTAFTEGADITRENLDKQHRQALMISHELLDARFSKEDLDEATLAAVVLAASNVTSEELRELTLQVGETVPEDRVLINPTTGRSWKATLLTTVSGLDDTTLLEDGFEKLEIGVDLFAREELANLDTKTNTAGVLRVISSTEVELFSNKIGDIFTKLVFKRVTQPATTDADNPANTDSTGRANYDVWLTTSHSLVILSGSVFVPFKQLSVSGLNELAFQEPDPGGGVLWDFVGGDAHGNEVLTSVGFFVDGSASAVPIVTGEDIPFTSVKFSQTSNCYARGLDSATRFAGDVVLAVSDRSITFANGDYTLDHDFTPSVDFTVNWLYLSMYTHGFDNFARYILQGDPTVYHPANVQNFRFDPDSVALTSDTTLQILDNRGYGIRYTVTPNSSPAFRTRVTRLGSGSDPTAASRKNKVYSSSKGTGSGSPESVTAGDTISTRAVYEVVVPTVEAVSLNVTFNDVQGRFIRTSIGGLQIDLDVSTLPEELDLDTVFIDGTRITWDSGLYENSAQDEDVVLNGSYTIIGRISGPDARYSLALTTGQQAEVDKLAVGWTSGATPFLPGDIKVNDGGTLVSPLAALIVDPQLAEEQVAEVVLQGNDVLVRRVDKGRTFTRTAKIMLIRNSNGNLQVRLRLYPDGFSVPEDFSDGDTFELIAGDYDRGDGVLVNLDGTHVANTVTGSADDWLLTVTAVSQSPEVVAQVDLLDGFNPEKTGVQVAGFTGEREANAPKQYASRQNVTLTGGAVTEDVTVDLSTSGLLVAPRVVLGTVVGQALHVSLNHADVGSTKTASVLTIRANSAETITAGTFELQFLATV